MDTTSWPIDGHYSWGQFVIVNGQRHRDELESLGYFGRDLDDIKRKLDSKRGPEDHRILDSVPVTEDDGIRVILSLHEAFFLTYALGSLVVKLNGTDSIIDIDTCWHEFRRYHRETNMMTDFAVEFCVYYYFRTRGWIVKSGNNYGSTFLLYKRSPSLDHSPYAIQIVQPGERKLGWQTVLTHHRVIQSVNKGLLIVHVEHPTGVYDRPSSIKDMRVCIRKVTCKTSLIT